MTCRRSLLYALCACLCDGRSERGLPVKHTLSTMPSFVFRVLFSSPLRVFLLCIYMIFSLVRCRVGRRTASVKARTPSLTLRACSAPAPKGCARGLDRPAAASCEINELVKLSSPLPFTTQYTQNNTPSRKNTRGGGGAQEKLTPKVVPYGRARLFVFWVRIPCCAPEILNTSPRGGRRVPI